MKPRALIIILGMALLSGTISGPAVVRAKDTAAQQREREESTEKTRTKLNRQVDKLAAGIRKAGAETRTELNRLYDEFKKKQAKAPKGAGGNRQGNE